MRFRSDFYGLPASSLLLLARRLKKISRVTARLQSRESIRTMFLPGGGKTQQGHEKNDARQPKTTAGPRRTSARQGGTEPGTTRFRDRRKTTGPPKLRRGLARPRPMCGQEAPTLKARKFSAWQILAPGLGLSSEADLEARKTHAELKNKLQEASVLGAPVRPFWL